MKNNSKVKKIATVAGIAATGSAAQAAIIYHDFTDVSVTFESPLRELQIDIEGGTVVNILRSEGQEPGSDFRLEFKGETEKPQLSGLEPFHRLAIDSSGASKLDSNDIIDKPDSGFYTSSYLENRGSGNWEGGATDKYVGFQLNVGETSNMFGWIRMDYDDVGDTITIKDFAYDTSGAGISAGSVIPELSTAALVLLAGSALLGLNLFRKLNKPS